MWAASARTETPHGTVAPSACDSPQALHVAARHTAAGRRNATVPLSVPAGVCAVPHPGPGEEDDTPCRDWRQVSRRDAAGRPCMPSGHGAWLPGMTRTSEVFNRTSLRMEMSSDCSSTIFLSRAFSSSSWRRRMASETSMPPYFARTCRRWHPKYRAYGTSPRHVSRPRPGARSR